MEMSGPEGGWGNFYNKERSGCESTPWMIKLVKCRSARWEEYSTQTSSVRNAEIFMTGYRWRVLFDGQDVNRNITKQQVIDMKDIVREYTETTELDQHNVSGNKFSASIKAGILTNLQRFQEFILSLVNLFMFTRLIIR